MDFAWTSMGGTLLDGSGDISGTTPIASLKDMIQTRLKASLDAWKLYRIGADLESLLGNANDNELQTAVARQIQNSLSRQLLPPGSFTVKVVPLGGQINAYVYVSQSLVATVVVNKQNATFRIS